MRTVEQRNRDGWEYEPDALGRIGQGNWRRNLAADSLANEEDDPDADVADLRRAWREAKPYPALNARGGLHLAKGVGRNQPNERADVARLEVALARAGYYDLNSTGGPTGYWGAPQEEALRRLQKDAGITSDGFLEPGQETHAKINEGLATDGQRGPGNQVAMAFALPAALPALEAAFPALARAGLGIAIGGAADQALKEFAKNPTLLDPTDTFLRRELRYPDGATPFPSGQSDFTGVPPPVPNHTGNQHPLPKLPAHTGNTEPPPKFPMHTGGAIPEIETEPFINVPPKVDPQDGGEIFPDQSGEIDRATILESTGGPAVRAFNLGLHERNKKIIETYGYDIEHAGGTKDEEGEKKKERYLPNKATGGHLGSNRTDIAYRHKKTGRHADIQTVDAYVSGEPTKREAGARDRVEINQDGGDLQVLIPKPRPGQVIDEEAYERLVREVFDEISKPYTGGPKTSWRLWSIYK